MNYEITGRLISKGEILTVTETFRKREFVIEAKEEISGREFVEYITFSLTQDRCASIDHYNIGDLLKVTFNIRGRRWEKDGVVKYFNSLEAWKTEIIQPGEIGIPEDVSKINEEGSFNDELVENKGNEEDDLPF